MRKQYSMQQCRVDLYRYRATLGERNFIERIKALTLLEEVLAVEIM